MTILTEYGSAVAFVVIAMIVLAVINGIDHLVDNQNRKGERK